MPTNVATAFALAATATTAAATATPFTSPPNAYVNLTGTPWPEALSVAACVGLHHRPSTDDGYGSGSNKLNVYMLRDGDDLAWLQLVHNIAHPPENLTKGALEFTSDCLADGGVAANRYILYNSTSQQTLVPNIVTLAGVLDAIPLDAALHTHGGMLARMQKEGSDPVFDATKTFEGFEPIDANRYVFEHYINETTGLSKMNPGYQSMHGNATLHPKLVDLPRIFLTDFVVKERLFNFFSVLGCLPGTEEHKLEEQIAKENPFPKPIAVYGYDNTFVVFGGDLFEAETTCVSGVGMGQIASEDVNNLAYFSRNNGTSFGEDITPLPHNPDVPAKYDPTKTYIAFLIGDGDNVAYLKGGRREWLTNRVSKCLANATQCTYPLLWTMNPHILHLAPDWGDWFAKQLLLTKTDRFALPPSGDLYSYPSLFPGDEQDTFVANTERDAQLLATSVNTAWEFAGTWQHALDEYFPRYVERGVVTAQVCVNVPYMIPALAFGSHFYKVLGDTSTDGNHSVVFRPNEWRGISGKDRQNLNVTEFAKEINSYPKGTVSPIYLTSDGGANLDDVDALVAALADHVVVAGNEIAQYALQAS